ncbi:Fe2+/Zn2+ uptake regulation protein [Synechococcus sp. PCC 7502]|uniref:Fur family transcriptional regulator n=1 Tax=Synechococcus sp. PCC 7502 TaxID=1173263 RepID=UPI00029F9301|nr:transcriptional repressor [Synechococcus sp. PCC 7502]AFY74819.1 Fe2+/Zn2+ uptake regulation protein [Synechococcus sp. PCC 7502]
MDTSTITEIMKSKGLRITPQRFSVYANLLARCDHPTVEQIWGDLNQDFSMSSKATVYSTLTALKDVGLVREVLLQDGVSRFDANVREHHHFFCLNCKAIEDLDWEVFHPPLVKLLRSGLKVTGYESTIYGLCDRCNTETN